MLDPGFVGSALQHIDVPALLKPVPQAFPERQGGGQLNNPIRILKERSIAGFARETVIELQRLEVSKHSGGAPRGAQREEARSLPIGSGSSTRNPLAKGPGQLGRKACSRLAHAGLAAKNLSSRGYAPFTADLQVSLRHTALSHKMSAGKAATAGAAEFKEPGLIVKKQDGPLERGTKVTRAKPGKAPGAGQPTETLQSEHDAGARLGYTEPAASRGHQVES